MSRYVQAWLRQEGDDVQEIEEAYSQLAWLQRELLDEYEPPAFVRFADRIDDWLDNFPEDADRRAMYRLLPRIFFIGRDQVNSLSRAAFNDIACRWVVDRAEIDLLAEDTQEQLDRALLHTWFYPITDSMKINTFLKMNGLGGHEIRPDWLSLSQLGDPKKVREFLIDQKIERIVMVEDFVGSGSQMSEAVLFAAETLPHTPKLVIPLVCCPAGLKVGLDLATGRDGLFFEPVLTLREDLFVLKEPREGEPAEFAAARRLSAEMAKDFGKKWADPFGHNDTGALVVLHTNCPDNTLPLIHDEGPNWKAIFPRIPRG